MLVVGGGDDYGVYVFEVEKVFAVFGERGAFGRTFVRFFPRRVPGLLSIDRRPR